MLQHFGAAPDSGFMQMRWSNGDIMLNVTVTTMTTTTIMMMMIIIMMIMTSFRVTAAYHKNLNIRVANDSLSFVKMIVLHKIITLNAPHFLRHA